MDVRTSGRKNFGVQAPFAGRMPYFTVIRPIITVHNIVHIIVLPTASKNRISTRCRLAKVHRTMRSYATEWLVVHAGPCSWLTGCCDHGRCSCILARGCVAVYCLSDNALPSTIGRTLWNSGRLLMPEKQNLDVLNTFCGRKYGRLGVIQNPALAW